MGLEELIKKFKELFPNLWNDSYRFSFVKPGVMIIYPGAVNKRAYTFVFRSDKTWSLSFA